MEHSDELVSGVPSEDSLGPEEGSDKDPGVLSGRVDFDLPAFVEPLYFNPERPEKKQEDFEGLDSLKFILVDGDGHPKGEYPEKDLRDSARSLRL